MTDPTPSTPASPSVPSDMTASTPPAPASTSSSVDAELEKEIADALGDQSIEELMGESTPTPRGAKGKAGDDDDGPQARFGTIAGVRDNEVLVELGAKTQGVCALDQFKKTPRVGDRVEFVVDSEMEDGLLRLLIPGGAGKADWKTLQQGQVIEAMVVGMNTGGLELKIGAHRGFMPVSQIELNRVEDLTPYLNKKLRCKVMELNRKRKRIVLSRRAIMEEEEAANRKQLVETLQVGEIRTGTVRRIAEFGAFVELLPGVDGLVHISDMAWSRIKDPKEVVSEGQSVQVKVLKVSESGERISLSIKDAGVDPWQDVEARYAEGMDVTGTVTRTTDFGAFVELSPGVEGLIHISQLSHDRINRVEQVVKTGDEVKARVTQVDPHKRRIGLSIRALTAVEQQPETSSPDDLRKYVKSDMKAARAGESLGALLSKFGSGDGPKGGIG